MHHNNLALGLGCHVVYTDTACIFHLEVVNQALEAVGVVVGFQADKPKLLENYDPGYVLVVLSSCIIVQVVLPKSLDRSEVILGST
jgi:hypothetical protein